MARCFRSLLIAITSLWMLSSLIRSSDAAGIATYWGQHTDEGSLEDACRRNTYDYVNLAFLINYGGGQTPELNLAGHCEPSDCSSLSSEIKACQSRGTQVLLSLGGAPNLSSADDAKEVASYLYNNFLGGESENRPLGDAVLDGIDFHIQGGKRDFLDDLAKALSEYSTSERRVHLSAAPQCFYPDYYLDAAIRTGLFDYVWVQFYNNPPCQYSMGNANNLFYSWSSHWASYPGVNKLFLGLPASPEAAPSGGYIPPQVLIREILPYVRGYPNYGGVMLWNAFYDENYSQAIRPYVNPETLACDRKSMLKSPSNCDIKIKSYVTK
ncbi:unnamed protein product [Coffea canephora]|uniref:chitinase n=1 Tax=Coffea canephora TaxID=49390 RepID=A0A068VB95_COFCA|nr:unnamed protein product [Coffea canephora]